MESNLTRTQQHSFTATATIRLLNISNSFFAGIRGRMLRGFFQVRFCWKETRTAEVSASTLTGTGWILGIKLVNLGLLADCADFSKALCPVDYQPDFVRRH